MVQAKPAAAKLEAKRVRTVVNDHPTAFKAEAMRLAAEKETWRQRLTKTIQDSMERKSRPISWSVTTKIATKTLAIARARYALGLDWVVV